MNDKELLNLSTFFLPFNSRPGAHLLTRRMCQDDGIKSIIISTLFGPTKVKFYSFYPCQWPNKTISDVLYISNEESSPILIEIPKKVDMEFYLNLISSAVAASQKYHKTPTLLIFCIGDISEDVKSLLKPVSTKPFLWKSKNCQPWSDSCFFVSNETLRSVQITRPLDPFVALCFFFIDQAVSLVAHQFSSDPSMQQLYCIAKKITEVQSLHRQIEIVEDILFVCRETSKKAMEIKTALNVEEIALAVKNSVKESLEEIILLTRTFELKYDESASSSILSTSSMPPTVAPPRRSRHEDWIYLDQELSNLPNNEPIPWQALYMKGKENGYFTAIGHGESLRVSYFKWKKNNK